MSLIQDTIALAEQYVEEAKRLELEAFQDGLQCDDAQVLLIGSRTLYELARTIRDSTTDVE